MFGLIVCSMSLYFSFRENMYACSFSSSISFSSFFVSVNNCICNVIGDRNSAATIPRMFGINASFKNVSALLVGIVDIPGIMISAAKTENKNSLDKLGSFREKVYVKSIKKYITTEMNACSVGIKVMVVFTISLTVKNMFNIFIELAIVLEAISSKVNIRKIIVNEDKAGSIIVPVDINMFLEVESIRNIIPEYR